MTTVNATTLITDGLGLIGVVGSTSVVNGNDLTLGLRVLNRMLDSWRQQPHMATHSAWITFTLPSGVATRTIGPLAQVDTVRPIGIEIGSYSTDGTNDRPLTPMTRDEYARIEDKAESATWPERVYYEASNPTGTLYFWPVSSGVTVKLAVRQQLATFASLTTDYALPDGYAAAIVPSLAEKLAPYFERQPSALVVRDAATARAALRRANAEVPQLVVHERAPHGMSGFLAGQ